MKTLFELPPPDAPEQHAGTGQTCGNCVHAVRPHRYRPDWIYCEETPDKRTRFGIANIKGRQAGCCLFEAKAKLEKREVANADQ